MNRSGPITKTIIGKIDTNLLCLIPITNWMIFPKQNLRVLRLLFFFLKMEKLKIIGKRILA